MHPEVVVTAMEGLLHANHPARGAGTLSDIPESMELNSGCTIISPEALESVGNLVKEKLSGRHRVQNDHDFSFYLTALH